MSNTLVSNFRERLIELVESSGKSQSMIASDFGIAKQTLSAWITGQNSPRQPIVYALSFYFDVSIEWLMGFDVPKSPNKSILSEAERDLIAAYRSANDQARTDALNLLLSHPIE